VKFISRSFVTEWTSLVLPQLQEEDLLPSQGEPGYRLPPCSFCLEKRSSKIIKKSIRRSTWI